jgi:hypothetical protein
MTFTGSQTDVNRATLNSQPLLDTSVGDTDCITVNGQGITGGFPSNSKKTTIFTLCRRGSTKTTGHSIAFKPVARVAELADALDLGSSREIAESPAFSGGFPLIWPSLYTIRSLGKRQIAAVAGCHDNRSNAAVGR